MLPTKKLPLELPLGVDIFSKLFNKEDRALKRLFVDKSLFIQEFIESGHEVSLIIRPRRWGKSLNMSMLHHFFAKEAYGQETQHLFDKLKIAKVDDEYYLKNHQGQYPVIFITLKSVKAGSFNHAIEAVKLLIQDSFSQHKKVLRNSKNLDTDDIRLFDKYLQGNLSQEELKKSLYILSKLLHQHYQKKVMLFIDEYDTPLNASYDKYLDEMTLFMKGIFGYVLKGNPYLEKGLMTGILRLSKNNMLSDINNLKVFSLFETQYSQHFGFSEEEVNYLLTQKGLVFTDDIKHWYNGYYSGKLIVYNPLSIVEYIDSGGDLRPYWVQTSDDELIHKALIKLEPDTQQKFKCLLNNEVIDGRVDEKLAYDAIHYDEYSLWSLLWTAGYLKAESFVVKGTAYQCKLLIPNYEVSCLFTDIFDVWLSDTLGSLHYDAFMKDLVDGNVKNFTRELGDYLMQSASLFDVAGDKKFEQFYHGFVLALIASLRDTHHVRSNRESGWGRYDIMIIPKSKAKSIGIILEFKHVKRHQRMKEMAKQALNQINAKHYATELATHDNITKIIKVGMVFCDKAVRSAYQTIDIKTSQPLDALSFSREWSRSGEESDDLGIYDYEDTDSEVNILSLPSDDKGEEKLKKRKFPSLSSEESGPENSSSQPAKKRQKLHHTSTIDSPTINIQISQTPAPSVENSIMMMFSSSTHSPESSNSSQSPSQMDSGQFRR